MNTVTNPLRDPRDLRLPRIAGPCSMVIFGVTGDLARKKVMPAIYDLANRGLLPPSFALVGFARRDWDNENFGKIVHDAVREHARTEFREEVWQQMSEGIRFVEGDIDDPVAFGKLTDTLLELDQNARHRRQPRLLLLHPPEVLRTNDRAAARPADCPSPSQERWRRVVIEKPFGHDLESAKELNDLVGQVFDSGSVFRIDHYLGKETVQNLLAIRFSNNMFEPIWNRNYIDHVQITMAEDIGIGSRAGYYDGIGCGPRRDPEPPHATARADRDGRTQHARRPTMCAGRRRRSSTRSRFPMTSTDTPRAASTRRVGRAERRSSGYLDEDGYSRRTR